MQGSYYTQRRPEVCDLVRGPVRTALDIGCAAGLLGEELLRRGLCESVDGIEAEPAAAHEAATRLGRVWVADLDDDGLACVGDARYDLVVLADVLEHVRAPWELLEQVQALLTPGAQVVLSIPNLRYFRVLGPLVLRGQFEYADSGVLDRTHLRFFTRKSIEGLVEGAGLRLEAIHRSPSPWRSRWKRYSVRALRDFGAEQFLVSACRGEVV